MVPLLPEAFAKVQSSDWDVLSRETKICTHKTLPIWANVRETVRQREGRTICVENVFKSNSFLSGFCPLFKWHFVLFFINWKGFHRRFLKKQTLRITKILCIKCTNCFALPILFNCLPVHLADSPFCSIKKNKTQLQMV